MLPNLVSIIGKFGSGKSLHMLEVGLLMANTYQKPLVCNFELNYKAVKEYCKNYKLDWFCKFGRIIYVDTAEKGAFAILRPKSVVLFDEVGVFLNARNWKNTNDDFLKRLPRLRHFDIHLVCAFQFIEQVEKNIREQCQYWIVCESTSKYDKKLGMPRMYMRFAYHHDLERFEKYVIKFEIRTSWIKKWFNALRVQWSYLFISDLICAIINIINVCKWYNGYLRCKNKRTYKCKFDVKLSKEAQLFKCYQSQGFGDKKESLTFPSEVVNVSWGLNPIPDVITRKNKSKSGNTRYRKDEFSDLMVK